MPKLMAAAAPASAAKLRVGSCMVNIDEAKQAGLDGVEVVVRGSTEQLPIADRTARQEYKDKMKQTGLVISSLQMGLLNASPLVSDPRAPAWLTQCIDAAKDLGAKVILVAFFSKGDLRQDGQLKKADVDVAVKRLKAAVPRATDAGVVLAIENTLSARQNAEFLERIGSDAVRVYYDVGNSTNNGYDVPAEIRFLKDRIASIHFKDFKDPQSRVQCYLGEGKVQFPATAAAIKEIDYQGWIVMETSSPSKNRVADAKRNAAYIRKLFGMT